MGDRNSTDGRQESVPGILTTGRKFFRFIQKPAGGLGQFFASGFRPSAVIIRVLAEHLGFPEILEQRNGKPSAFNKKSADSFNETIVALLAQVPRIDQGPRGVEHRIAKLDRRPFEVAFPKRGLGPVEIRLSRFELFCDQRPSSGKRPDLPSPQAVLISQTHPVLPRGRCLDRFRSRKPCCSP